MSLFFFGTFYFLFLPINTEAANCISKSAYYDLSKKEVYIINILADASAYGNADRSTRVTLKQDLGGDPIFIGSDDTNNYTYLKTGSSQQPISGGATIDRWTGTLRTINKSNNNVTTCTLTADPGTSSSGGIVSGNAFGGEQPTRDEGACSGVFDKAGMWLAQTLAKSMTGYFSLINKELNNNTDIDSTSLKDVFEKVRNVAISLLTLALIIIAFANVLQVDLDKYGINRIIPKLIIAIVLSYFSFLIARVMLESANALQALLLNNMAANGKGTDSLSVGTQLTAKLNEGCGAIDGLGGLLLMIIVIIITVVAFLWILLLLLARKAVLFALVAVAPLAFIFNALPFTEFLYKQWWTRFIKWVYMGPAIMFFLYLGVEFMDSAAQGQDITIMVLLSGIAVYIAAMMPLVLGKEVFSGIQKAAGKAAGLAKMPRKALDASKKVPFIGQKARELSKRLDLREASKDQRANIEAQRWQAEKAQGGKFSRWMAGTSPEQAKRLEGALVAEEKKAIEESGFDIPGSQKEFMALQGDNSLKGRTRRRAIAEMLAERGLHKDDDKKYLEALHAEAMSNPNLMNSITKDQPAVLSAWELMGKDVGPLAGIKEGGPIAELAPRQIQNMLRKDDGRASLVRSLSNKDSARSLGSAKSATRIALGQAINNLSAQERGQLFQSVRDEEHSKMLQELQREALMYEKQETAKGDKGKPIFVDLK